MPGTENIWYCYHCRHHVSSSSEHSGDPGLCRLFQGLSARAQGLGLSAQGSGAEACGCSNPPASSKHSPFPREGAASPTAF